MFVLYQRYNNIRQCAGPFVLPIHPSELAQRMLCCRLARSTRRACLARYAP